MAKYQRNKGKRGEREAAKALSKLLGVPVRRSQQYCGAAGDADLTGLPALHLEVKRTERLSLYPALEKAAGECGGDGCPVILHRRNRKRWIAAVYLDDLPALAEAVMAIRRNGNGDGG